MKSKPATANLLEREIAQLTTRLIELSLSNDQNYPYQIKGPGSRTSVQYPTTLPRSSALKDRPYAELYEELLNDRAFNVLMLDGAILQLYYELEGSSLRRSRLAFLPSPTLLQYQNMPEEYIEDSIYAEIVDRRVMPVPLRFDYDDRVGVSEPGVHPKSHLTLGQYANCRVAATAPVTPYAFVEFVLRCFYKTDSDTLGVSEKVQHWTKTINDQELRSVHIGIPEP